MTPPHGGDPRIPPQGSPGDPSRTLHGGPPRGILLGDAFWGSAQWDPQWDPPAGSPYGIFNGGISHPDPPEGPPWV